jgi:hypothetical protein
MNFEIEGKLIEKYDIEQVTDSFKKREFVIEKTTTGSGKEFIDTIKFQLIQDKCDQLNSLKIGDTIKVFFNIKGRKWMKNGQTSYFNNLEAWKIDAVGGNFQTNVPPPDISEANLMIEDDSDDLPF